MTYAEDYYAARSAGANAAHDALAGLLAEAPEADGTPEGRYRRAVWIENAASAASAVINSAHRAAFATAGRSRFGVITEAEADGMEREMIA